MTLTFRSATIEDARVLFDWRNDPLTRLGSLNPAELEFDSHVGWLSATLANPQRQLFIVEESGRAVGTVRVDHAADGSAELSWTVAPQARGRGIARPMVQLIADDVSRTCAVRAQVKTSNEASIKVAEAAGMRIVSRHGDILHFYRAAATPA